MRIGAVIHPTAVSGSEPGPQLKRFSRHVIEMTVAMMLGMCVLGMTFRAIHLAVFGTGFDAAWHEHTELAVFAMTFNMTLPMLALMRYRGHGWERCAEMAAAMFGSPDLLAGQRLKLECNPTSKCRETNLNDAASSTFEM